MPASREFTNTLYTNDNLFVLNGMNSDLADLIYLDPPFKIKGDRPMEYLRLKIKTHEEMMGNAIVFGE